ncbi:MAG: hypothetical protein A2X13_07760 [Bacteroidetes bacterium GWC2_33_15]|nr:MAG: hypothetical protein A2X10_04815 [Bacteroidetes bacterium GWA2_33_15]OFX52647.1 MAG: hypothetical protein A2X13_07760 [Bacteroidetes bacterium GWC2_33_15]OFX64047.1 MAG: hypothetical protein A2X15_02575 [Bacteroidetes bacterium GWB2_32_14]OFX67268.1 MAG: hypothetical protein A2X14_11840 [Bacteroidetes bacterium GWD2_33_33]HAN18873.1 hypothetical protein [Bacteroidales bacterium]
MPTIMSKKYIYKLFIGIILTVFISEITRAQNSQTLYYMNRIPQSTLMNPAIQPTCNFFLGLPVVSSIQMGAGNNQLALTDVIMKHPVNDSLITFLHPDAEFDKSDFLGKLDENNFFFEDFQTDLLSFGFRVNTWYFSFNLSEKMSLSINYPKDLLVLALEGNESFMNQTADLSMLGVNMLFYREYGLGVSKQINPNLTIGIRGKVLFGHVAAVTDNKSLGFYSSRDSLYINANTIVNTSSPMIAKTNADGEFDGFDVPSYIENSETDSLIDLALAHQNMGLGIDLGIYYKPIDKLALSLSIVDLGYIKWNKDVTNLELNGDFTFKGIDAGEQITNDSIDDPFQIIVDSLENSFKISNKSESFTSGLGTKVYFGASWLVSNKFDLSVLSRTYFYNDNINQAFTFSANARPARWLTTSVSYSIMNGTYNNIGFGLVLGGAPLQLYVITDNASAALWGQNTSSFNFRFGLNVNIGCRKKSKDKDLPLLRRGFF